MTVLAFVPESSPMPALPAEPKYWISGRRTTIGPELPIYQRRGLGFEVVGYRRQVTTTWLEHSPEHPRGRRMGEWHWSPA